MTSQTNLRNRIALLEEFRTSLLQWNNERSPSKERDDLRRKINQSLRIAKTAIKDAGAMRLVSVVPPPMIGGPIMHNIDLFEMVFGDLCGDSPIPQLVDMIDVAIGVYQALENGSDLVRLQSVEAIDIEAGLERALRPVFKAPPESEKVVQDAVETVLNALGIVHEREKEVAPVGGRAFKPDFTCNDLNLAIEVKLAKTTHGPSAIQEEIAADVSAYKTKWHHILFVIYDIGVFDDPYGFRRENMKHFGVSVLVVKH